MSFDPWTLGFQGVNVLVLVWLLHRFFWKPVAAMIDARQSAAATLLDKAKARRSEAEAALTEVEATRAGLAAERDASLAAARKDAAAVRDTLLAAARAEADALNDSAKSARVRAAETLKAAAREDAKGLALTIAGRLVARLDVDALDAAFLGWLVQGIADLSHSDRSVLLGVDLDVVSATAQDSTAQDRITRAITAVLGTPAKLTFRTDPALIAGHELHSPHFILRNSWAADLARIAGTLADEGVMSDAA